MMLLLNIYFFGDSITFEAHVSGDGTTSGETYPAYLKEIICSYLKTKDNTSKIFDFF